MLGFATKQAVPVTVIGLGRELNSNLPAIAAFCKPIHEAVHRWGVRMFQCVT